MKLSLTLFFCFSLLLSFSQNIHKAIVVDAEGKEPLEFVAIFNDKDHTLTNADGRFLFSSKVDSVVFYRVGYDKLTTSFSKLQDTVFLKKSLFELDEVVVTNAKTIYQKIKDSIADNYLLKPHTETFFIRAVLRRNDTIVRLQDMQGKVKRKTSVYTGSLELEKKDYKIELMNMRQLGISKDQDDIYFNFPTFYNIFKEFVRINAMGPDFDVIEKPFENGNNIKVEFTSSYPEDQGKGFGHYIINGNDNAILSFNASTIPFYPAKRDNKKKYSRLLEYKTSVFFKEDRLKDLYYINYAKRNALIEINNVDNSTLSTYEEEIILYTTESFGNDAVKSNVNEHKDIFKLKHTYNSKFWQSQNQLLLTDEMQAFIEKMGEKNKEFKVRSNMN